MEYSLGFQCNSSMSEVTILVLVDAKEALVFCSALSLSHDVKRSFDILVLMDDGLGGG